MIAPATPYLQIPKGPDVATKLALTLTCGDYEITRPLADGSAAVGFQPTASGDATVPALAGMPS